MIIREFKNVRRIITAVVGGRVQLLVFAVFASLTTGLLIFGKGPSSQGIATVLSIAGGFFWFMAGSGCLATLHHSYQLRLAGVARKTYQILLCAYVLLSILPALPAPSFIGMLGVNTVIATLILLLMMLTPAWFIPALLMFYAFKYGWSEYLPAAPARPYTWWYVALPLLSITWLRWRTVRVHDTSAQHNPTILVILGNTVSTALFSTRPNNSFLQSRWLLPRGRDCHAQTERLRTLIGVSLAPGAWQRQALFNFILLFVLSVDVDFVQRLSLSLSEIRTKSIFIHESMITTMIAIAVLSLLANIQFLYRKESNDLAELALLPGLPAQRKIQWLKRAMLKAACLQGLGVASGLLLIAAWFHQLSFSQLPVAAGSIVISAFFTTTLALNIATSPQMRGSLLRLYAWLLAFIPGVAAWYFFVRALIEAKMTMAVVSLLVLAIWLALVLWLHATRQKKLAALPHPFLEVS